VTNPTDNSAGSKPTVEELRAEVDRLRAELSQQDEWRTGPAQARIATLERELAEAREKIAALKALIAAGSGTTDDEVVASFRKFLKHAGPAPAAATALGEG